MDQASPKNPIRKYWLLTSLILLAAIGLSLWLNKSITSGGTAFQTTTAALGSLTSNVEATGTVRAARSTTLVWNSDGRVETINASVGTKVASNQVLASLAQDSVSKNIILAESDLVAAQQNLDSLLQSNTNLAQAMQNLADAKQVVMDAQIKLDFYDWTSRGRAPGALLEDFRDKITAAQNQLKFIEWIGNKYYRNTGNDLRRKADYNITLTNNRLNLADLIAQYNWFTGRPSVILMEQTQAELNLALARQEDAQRELDRLKGGKSIDDITAAQAKLAAAQATLNLSKIIAPFDGTVTQTQSQPGDRISANQNAFRVDDLSHLMVDLQISEVDINNIATGQPVTISLEAIPNKIYQGVVTKVNLAAKASQSGVNFKVSVTLTDVDEQVRPGMTAVVTIATKEVDNALLVPNSAVRMLNGQRTVYVLKENQPVPLSIRLGASANDQSQVVGGDLKVGDMIILNPPSLKNTSTSATPVK